MELEYYTAWLYYALRRSQLKVTVQPNTDRIITCKVDKCPFYFTMNMLGTKRRLLFHTIDHSHPCDPVLHDLTVADIVFF